MVFLMTTDETFSGEMDQILQLKEAYTFTTWEPPLFNYLSVKWEQGGLVLPSYSQKGDFRGILIIGEGELTFNPPNEKNPLKTSISSAYFPLNENSWDHLKVELKQTASILPDKVRNKANDMLKDRKLLYFSIYLFGYQRNYIPADKEGLALFHDNQGLWVKYQEYDTIKFQKKGEKVISYDNPLKANPFPKNVIISKVTIITTIFFFMILLLTLMLTVEIFPYRKWEFISNESHHPSNLYLFSIFVLFAVSQIILKDNFHWYGYTINLSLFLLAVIPYLSQRNGWKYIGFSFYHPLKQIVVVLSLSIIFQMAGSLQWPKEMSLPPWGMFFWQFLKTYFFIALIQELYWRIVVQNTLERLLNKWWALFITTFFISVIQFTVNTFEGMMSSTELYLQSFLIAPAGFFVIGLLFIRTRSILSTSLLASLLILLPKWLQY
ncbi:hypothetical protein L1765_11990 [Microaerobacter geothermalis]|uniref:CPBP family glutamic-type intramembrane protease n=1 Tax=Microaerobacter geothermalis TaxID=674972 RepID=UPI001F3F24EC|nr:CPBP family intramembrane glutamic endopeptidase [Microaerobacter geothermalis]MCF6094682.1 hypothetical protein [Microaerobacter geothermalis]